MTQHHKNTGRLLASIALTSGLAASPALADLELDTSPANYKGTTLQDEQPAEELQTASDEMFTRDGWEGSFSAGINGSTGNNENFNARAGFVIKKETTRNEANADVTYTYASSDGDASENELNANARYDWLIPDSRWRVFVIGSYEYDEFQDWDHRVTIGPGVGYQAIKNDKTDLLLRTAVLAVREFGGSDDDWRAEINPGLDFEHKITDRQTFTTSLDFYSEIGDFDNYRFIGSAAWRVEMDPDAGLFLELGVEDEYDSNPGPGTKKNDFSYYASVGWAF